MLQWQHQSIGCFLSIDEIGIHKQGRMEVIVGSSFFYPTFCIQTLWTVSCVQSVMYIAEWELVCKRWMNGAAMSHVISGVVEWWHDGESRMYTSCTGMPSWWNVAWAAVRKGTTVTPPPGFLTSNYSETSVLIAILRLAFLHFHDLSMPVFYERTVPSVNCNFTPCSGGRFK